jgi:hypothetical protein
MQHAEDRSQASALAWLKRAYQSTQRASSASGAHPRAKDRAQSTAARRAIAAAFCWSNPDRTDLGTRRPREISYRVLTMSLDRAIARNASRIFIRCISPQSLHLIFFVVFQTLARLEASIATSHWLCPFVAGHLNVRNAVIVNIWALAWKSQACASLHPKISCVKAGTSERKRDGATRHHTGPSRSVRREILGTRTSPRPAQTARRPTLDRTFPLSSAAWEPAASVSASSGFTLVETSSPGGGTGRPKESPAGTSLGQGDS